MICHGLNSDITEIILSHSDSTMTEKQNDGGKRFSTPDIIRLNQLIIQFIQIIENDGATLSDVEKLSIEMKLDGHSGLHNVPLRRINVYSRV